MGGGTPIKPYTYVRYDDPGDIVKPWNPRSPDVAARVVPLLNDVLPEAMAEHIGSTAIPGCDGKGVIDLMLPYSPGGEATVLAALGRLGFREHVGSQPFPPGRSVWVGSITHDDRRYQIHVHSLPASDPEVAHQRHFRDTLRADPALVAAYVADKHRIAAAGSAANGGEYADAKGAFIRSITGAA